jgi:hypothetical protein
MAPESWLVLTVAAGFFLLGVAGSPLAWVALLSRRTRSERASEQRFLDLAGQLQVLQERLERIEASSKTPRAQGEIEAPGEFRLPTIGRLAPRGRVGQAGVPSAPAGGPGERMLIAVPNLAATKHDREAVAASLAQRHEAIWSLAKSGASPEVIARATGQPIGQIELILRLRRQVDGTRTTIPHAPQD